MPRRLVILSACLLWPLAAGATECPDWVKMSVDQKPADVKRMIDGHLDSNVGRKFTSENKAAMRRCLNDFVPRIVDDFDDACSDGKSRGKNALDDIFDRYLLSCVQ